MRSCPVFFYWVQSGIFLCAAALYREKGTGERENIFSASIALK
jgi:hypothetical protein